MTNIKSLILNEISSQQKGTAIDLSIIDPEISLMEIGLLDSIGFINLVLEIAEKMDAGVSLSDIDPFEHASLNGLIRLFSVDVK